MLASMQRIQHKTSPHIERIAMKLGANVAQITNWRYRGVPAAWRLAIVANSRGTVALGDFPVDEKKRKRRRVTTPPPEGGGFSLHRQPHEQKAARHATFQKARATRLK